MTYLQAIGLAGFRSYSQDQIQRIQFQQPLTLIWGSNGSGKTTIIEALKFMTTGAFPPGSNSGKNFIMDPKIANKSQVIADGRIRFKSFNNMQVIAKRRVLLTSNSKGLKFQSIQQSLKSKSKEGEVSEVNHQCTQIQKQISQVIGISKPILQNISFCHQEESLWPFSDSTTLKMIFDQVFQTKKYAKVIQNFEQVQKQYAKELKQLKKDLDYYKRIFDEDIKRKNKSMKEMKKVGDQCDKLLQLKGTLSQLQHQVKSNICLLSQSNKKRSELFVKKGGFQERIKRNNIMMKQLANKMMQIIEKYEKINGSQIQYANKNQEERLLEICNKIENVSSEKKTLQVMFQQAKNLNILNQKQMQISTQINRIKQILPDLKKVNMSNHQIIQKLQVKKQYLQNLKKQSIILKQEKEKLIIPRLFQMTMDEKLYKINKHLLEEQKQAIQQTKNSILFIYNNLHKKIEQSSLKKLEQSIEQKLRQIKLNLKIKREELQKYEKMPIKESLKDRKFMLSFAGIQFYDRIYHHCLQKHKCAICYKEMNQHQIANLKSRFQKSKNNTQKRIKQLQQQEQLAGQTYFNPEELIKNISQQITQLQYLEKDYSNRFQQYKIQKQKHDQLQLNLKLERGLKKINLQPHKISLNNIKIDVTLQNYMELLNIYQKKQYSLDIKSKQLRDYQQKVRKNNQTSLKIAQIQQKRRKMQQKLAQYQQQLQNFQIIRMTHEKLTILLRVKGKLSKNRSNLQSSGKQKQNNLAKMELNISKLTKQLQLLSLQKQYYQCFLKNRQLFGQTQLIQYDENLIINQLHKIDAQISRHSHQTQKYNEMRVQYQTKKRQIDLKGDMIFNEYNKKMESDYIIKKKKIVDLQKATKEIQYMCLAIEETINTTHQMKMDQINQILLEIWRKVYHGTDINKIQIQASYQYTSKRRKNYLYTIIMQKQNKAKIQMRGRCSMGQKVLASILIRLAIAETFTQSACILTLDEPTTNLDRQHIDSLAIQLGRLIEYNNYSFLQLIIISHDLEFIKRLQKYTNCYFEVKRNKKNFSEIIKKDIQQLHQENK